jgi:Fe-S cluster assembly iron-binding protein IscA
MRAQLEITQRAHEKLSELLDGHPEAPAVRIIYDRDTCKGPSLMIRFDAPAESDARVEHEGVTYVIDAKLADDLGALTVDFVQREHRAGFEILAEKLPDLVPGPPAGGCL